ncbi:MAG: dienelactone hydrolase family protein [Planctomycetota bacterium]
MKLHHLLVIAAIGLAASAAAATEPATNAEMIARGDRLVARIARRVDTLKANAPDILFSRHLQSVMTLVRTDWVRCKLLLDDRPEHGERSLGYMETILEGLEGEAGTWEPYARGERALVMAFQSAKDRSVQPYALTLPSDWDPDDRKAYPTIVYLHGYVPKPDPLWYVALSFGPKRPTATQPAATALEPHITVAPWGRGNAGYTDGWESDVFEALADAKRTVRIDDDRLSLCGHSMGGFGTWSIGVRTPDRWAALAIYAGGDRAAPAGTDLAGNLNAVPVYIWHGAKDQAVPVRLARDLADELRRFGHEPIVVIDPEAEHMPPPEAKHAAKAWMLQQRRRPRPEAFTYVADTNRHRGVWGVTLRRDSGRDPVPRLRCTIDGNILRIDSQGTTGLTVQLGDDGLGLSGEVTVVWNGQQAYQGPAKIIDLGDGTHWRRRKRD